jgi:geranylgeranyl reductase family protein
VYDVAVVGGGPAGAAAARAAAQLGASTVLLERAVLPRYKRCGGGLVGVSAATAGIDLAPLARDAAGRVLVTCGFGLRWSRAAPGPLLTMVARSELDAALVEAAAAAGARVRERCVVTGAEQDRHAVTLRVRGGDPVRARYVVAADGVSSRLAAAAGVRLRQVDLGLEGEFRAPRGWAGRLWLDWGPVPGSYAWLFPKGDTVTVGVIGDRRQPAGLRAYYAAVVGWLGLAAPLLEGGHHTRVRAAGSPLVDGRVLLAGDAAGWLEPWSREGISFALRSGRLAGEAAAQQDPAAYPRRAQAALQPEVAAGGQLLRAFTAHPRSFHAALASPPGWREFRRLLGGVTSLASLSGRAPVRAALRVLGAAG